MPSPFYKWRKWNSESQSSPHTAIHCTMRSEVYLTGKLMIWTATHTLPSENLQSELPVLSMCLVFASHAIYNLDSNGCLLGMFFFLPNSFKSLFPLSSFHDFRGNLVSKLFYFSSILSDGSVLQEKKKREKSPVMHPLGYS